MGPIKLVIVDDHRIVRDGIKAMLFDADNVEMIGSLASGPELFEFLKHTLPDIIILDIVLPELSGIDVAKIVRTQFPKMKILMLSGKSEEELITESIKSGANGFLPKNTSREEFLVAIDSILKGEQFFGQDITQTIYSSFVKNLANNKSNNLTDTPKLSDRELEIIRLFSDGLLYKEIGDRLNISPRTVESHKNNIMTKLELRTTIDLVKYAIKHNIVEL